MTGPSSAKTKSTFKAHCSPKKTTGPFDLSRS
jgi:hypothetical protein